MFVLQTRSTNTNVDFSLSDSLVQTGNLPKLVFQRNPTPTVGSLGMLKPALPRSSGKKNQRTSSWLRDLQVSRRLSAEEWWNLLNLPSDQQPSASEEQLENFMRTHEQVLLGENCATPVRHIHFEFHTKMCVCVYVWVCM